MVEKDEFEGKSWLNILAAVVFIGGIFLMLFAGTVDMAKIPEWCLIAAWFFVVLMVTFSIAGAARTQERFARIEKHLGFYQELADTATGKSEQGDEAGRKYIAGNSNKVPAVLVVFVALLCAYNIYLSRKIYLMSENAEIDHLRVQRIELVQPSGQVSGTFYAGYEGSSPEIKLVQAERGNQCTLGFAADGTGPRLEMLSELSLIPGTKTLKSDPPQSIIKLGATSFNRQGLSIRGRDSVELPIFTGWQIDRRPDGTSSGEYVRYVPGVITSE